MAKSRSAKRVLDSYTIRGTNKIVRAGDCVLICPAQQNVPPYVARIEKIEADARQNVTVKVRWFYRPEEVVGGRRAFHGSREVFLSDHFDIQSAETIIRKCVILSFEDYTKLENVGPDDHFCRLEYKTKTGDFLPENISVYCKCEMPYNPDDLMIECESCSDWYHPGCIGMTAEQAKQVDHFVCTDCIDQDAPSPCTSLANDEVETKRQKK